MIKDPISNLRSLLNDGDPIEIQNFSKRSYKKHEELSLHGYQLLLRPDIRNIDTFMTPVENFFVRNHLEPPVVDINKWRLKLQGCFEKEATLSIDDIKGFEVVTRAHIIECTGNQQSERTIRNNFRALFGYINVFSFDQLIQLLDPAYLKWWISFLRRTGLRGGNLISNGIFSGVRLFDVLEKHPLTKYAKEIVFEGMDKGAYTPIQRIRKEPVHYARSWSIKELRKYEPILCFEMNGSPLTTAHGYPLRLIIPGIYGHEQVKWIGRITAIPEKHKGYFQNEHYGYKINGEMIPVHEQRPKSMTFRVVRKGDKITVFGVAWRGMSPIDRVEISVDGMNTWELATLLSREVDTSWLFWEYELPEGLKGNVAIASRVFCVNGDSQPLKPSKYCSVYGCNYVFSVHIKI